MITYIKNLFCDPLTPEERADYTMLENGIDDPLWHKGAKYVERIYEKLGQV